MTDRDLYSRLLLAKGHGYPLSYPQPPDDLPPESRAKGIEIGDVGVLTSDGAFDVIFNICRAPDDPVREISRLGSCITAQDLMFPIRESISGVWMWTRIWIMFSPVGAGAVVEISTSSKQAAVLLMPEGASRINVRFLDILRQQALKHAQNWYAFLRNLGCMVENGELYLVTGADKSSSWSVAAGENHSQDGSISLKLKAAQIGSAGSSYAWQWETAGGFADSGPRRRPGEESSTQNQTVFLRGFRIAIHSLVWKKVSQAIPVVDSKPLKMFSRRWFSSFVQSASLGTRAVSRDTTAGQNTGSAPRDEEYDVEYSPGIPRPYHPADAINKHILASSPSGIIAVVTHDDEWMSALRENEETVPTESELIGRVSEQYTMKFTHDGAYLYGSNMDQSAPSSTDIRALAPLTTNPGRASATLLTTALIDTAMISHMRSDRQSPTPQAFDSADCDALGGVKFNNAWAVYVAEAEKYAKATVALRYSFWFTVLSTFALLSLGFTLFLLGLALLFWPMWTAENFAWFGCVSIFVSFSALLQVWLHTFELQRRTSCLRNLMRQVEAEYNLCVDKSSPVVTGVLSQKMRSRLQRTVSEIEYRSLMMPSSPWPLHFRTRLELFLDIRRTVREIEQVLKMIQSSDEMQALHQRRELADDRRLGVGSDLPGGGSWREVEKKKASNVRNMGEKVLWTLSSGRIFSKLWRWYISRRKGEDKEIGFDSDEVERRDGGVLRAQRVGIIVDEYESGSIERSTYVWDLEHGCKTGIH
ncbi:hypothetical protein B0H13DRAFT_2277274 [Mycena leptocephala]|nr:hypothetical protein B0H13DRAFT_2277274 [Mycena leptocephala]